ncbi:MAG: succinate dehydrogenase, cytochrome b556 subunit [Anaerolineae bacterium]|nr:succinate dehydrogenase, cytochrome b556 subunit [Anaerolineae bacterium]
MSSLVLTLRETLRYRGAVGQWSWVLHRLTGLGVVFFFILHVIGTSWAVFAPALYEKEIKVYQSPLFTLGEFALTFAVVYHAFNGMRIAIFDYRPEWWKHQQRAAYVVFGLTILTLIPTFAIMFSHVLAHYAQAEIIILPIPTIIEAVSPFIIGMALAVIAAVVLSGVVGLFTRNRDMATNTGRGSRVERFWWSYMRVSGLLIVPLVFGHLAMVHVIQGVFHLTTADYVIVGTTAVNQSGTVVEFVGERWNYLLAGVAIWRFYDVALLALVAAHGFNGLRYVLTDFTMSRPLLRRAAMYACFIGGAITLSIGAASMIATIDQTAVQIAAEEQCRLAQAYSINAGDANWNPSQSDLFRAACETAEGTLPVILGR